MKIIAGSLKGQKLCAFSAGFIRPMTSRVKACLFDTLYSLNQYPKNCYVLDLFAGVGSLSWEALSRGALNASLVEQNVKAIHIIKKNQAKLKVGKKARVYKQDVFRFLSFYEGRPFDLILADPPFKECYGQKLVKALSVSKAYQKGSVLALEISTQEGVPTEHQNLNLIKKKVFGDKQLLLYISH